MLASGLPPDSVINLTGNERIGRTHGSGTRTGACVPTHTQHAGIRTFFFSLCFGESTFKVGNVVCLSEKDYPHIVAWMGKPVKLTGGCFYHMCWLLFHSQSSPGIRLLDSGRETLTTLTHLQSARIRWIQITRQVLPGHPSVGWPEKVQGTGLACHDGL